MESYEEVATEEDEEEFEALLAEGRAKKEFPNLSSLDEIVITLPKGMSRKAFLKAVEALSQPPKPRGQTPPKCDTCSHLAPDNHCRFQSCECATAILNHRMPTRYTPKET